MYRALAALLLITAFTNCAVPPLTDKWPYESCADADGMVMNIKLFCNGDTSHSCTQIRTTTTPSCIIGESSYSVYDTITCINRLIDKKTLVFECLTNNAITDYGVLRRIGFRKFRLVTYNTDSTNRSIASYVMKRNKTVRAKLHYSGPDHFDSVEGEVRHHIRRKYYYNQRGDLDSIVSKDKFIGVNGKKKKVISVFLSQAPKLP